MTYDPKYKLKHRLPSIGRLSKYDRLPPPMIDEPPEARQSGDWSERCRIVYDYMLSIKRRQVFGSTPKAASK